MSILGLIAVSVLIVGIDILSGNADKCLGESLLTPVTNTDNNSLTIFADPHVNSFSIGQVVTLLMENNTSYSIWFPAKREISIYQLDSCGNEIKEIDDMVNNDLAIEFILGPKGSENSRAGEFILPSVSSNVENVMLRVYIAGYFVENGKPTSRKIMGYTDFRLVKE